MKWRTAAMATGLGFEFVALTLAGIWLGQYLDELLGTRDVMVLVGLGLGLAGFAVQMWRVLGSASAEEVLAADGSSEEFEEVALGWEDEESGDEELYIYDGPQLGYPQDDEEPWVFAREEKDG